MPAAVRIVPGLLLSAAVVAAQTYAAPAGIRPPSRHAGSTILPGGRVIAPFGDEYATGPGPFGISVSASGKTVATANAGPWRYSVSILERGKGTRWEARHLAARAAGEFEQRDPSEWRGVSIGVALAGDRGVYVSEGNSGRVSFFDPSDERRRIYDLNQGDFRDSYTGDLALDAERNILYVADQANHRVVALDARNRQVLSSIKVGRLPFALALSPNRQKLYVTNVGMFLYRALPGADPSNPAASGLSFPAFGFPGPDSRTGAERRTARGVITVPGLGDPNAPESNSLCVVDVADPSAARVETFIRTGLPAGDASAGGSSPSGVVATASRVFVSNATNDSVTVIDAATNRVEFEIPIRIPGLEALRGVLPIGMAYHEKTGWLFVAEAGINAVGVIDVAAKRVLGHIPAAWYPTRVALDRDTVIVANAKGHGEGPSAARAIGAPARLYRGSVSIFQVPTAAELAPHTAFVMAANGFGPAPQTASRLPEAIRHVVLIVKESRSYDEVLGDVERASNGAAMGSPELARLGSSGFVDGRHVRMSIRDADLTPNHHEIAKRWAFSDNFYADSDGSVDGHHWLNGVYPNAWTQSSVLAAYGDMKDFRLSTAPGRLAFAGTAASIQPEDQSEAGSIWRHFASHGVTFRNFGEGFELAGVSQGTAAGATGERLLTNMPMDGALYDHTSREYPGFNVHISDQVRASQVIREIDERYGKGGADLPQFVYIHLPGDYTAGARPAEGYPYEESFIADNDLAFGRIVEYLSGTRWWNDTVVFITEDDAEAGFDHIDAHRTLLLCAGPWSRRNYVAHTNTSFPGLLKTIFELLHVPPLNLFDASASDLADCFSGRPDASPYRAVGVDKRIFDPSAVQRKTPAGDSARNPGGLKR